MSSSDEEERRRPKRYKTFLDPSSHNFGVPPRRSLLEMEKAVTDQLPGPSNVSSSSRSPSPLSSGHLVSGHSADHERSQSTSPSNPASSTPSSDDQVSISSDSEMYASDQSDGEENVDHLLIEDEEILEENPPPPAPQIDEEVLKHNAYSKKYFLDAEVVPSANLTRFEILTVIQHFNLRFGLSNRGVVALIELVNTILGREVIPASHFIFQEIFLSQSEKTFHFFCPKCSLYVSESDPPENLACPDCHENINPKTTGPSTNYFVTLSLESQLRKQLEENGPKYINYMRNRPQTGDVISDVMDGLLYQDLRQEKSMSDTDFTLSFNTDGANLAESNSKNSVWPIQARLNEIDPIERFSVNNVILAGVVYGKTPKMTAYLTPFIKELKKLARQGLTWYNNETNEFITSKIHLLLATLDTPAKAKVLRMVQFNGKDGCYLCSHPGNLVNVNQIRYGTADHREEKTNESIRADMMAALQTGAKVNGQKGASPLIALQYFSFPFSVVIDVMHSHFLGVSKALVSKIWMNSKKYKHRDFYLTPEKITVLDGRIMKMTPPSEISREPRSITQHSDWKANEWRKWLFYYGPVVLRGILPNRYVKHFCLLSCSLFILSQATISRNDLPIVHEYLEEFVRQYEVYYGLENMTSNVHSTTHLKSCVIWGGPLWAHSAFQFESVNGVIINLVHGTTGVPQEIARRFITFSKLPKTISLHPSLNDVVVSYCEFVLSSGCPRYKKSTSLNDATILGDRWREKFIPTAEEREIISAKFEDLNLENLYTVKKIKYRRSLLTADSTGKYRDDTVIKLNDNNYARISKIFFSATNANQIFLLINEINLEDTVGDSFSSKFHVKTCEAYAYEDHSACNLTDVAEKAVFISYDQVNKYVSDFPNRYEKD